MKTCPKFIVSIVSIMLLSTLTRAQTIVDVLGNKNLAVTFIGIDFSKAIYIGDTGIVSADEMKYLLNQINMLMITEHKKYYLNTVFRKKNMVTDITVNFEINKTVDPKKLVSDDSIIRQAFIPDSIKSIIRNYKFNSTDSDTALVIVMDKMNKTTEQASMWFTFLYKQTKEIIFTKKVK